MVIEQGLVDAARAGGPALDRLISAIWPQAFRLSFGILRDRGLAEDAAQEACARIAVSLDQLSRSSHFEAWGYRVIVRQAITTARRRRYVETLDAATAHAVEVDRSDAIDIRDALGTLPVVQRAAVILHYYAGFTSSEVAAATGLPSSTVRFHLMHARRRLRAALTGVPADGARNEVLADVQ